MREEERVSPVGGSRTDEGEGNVRSLLLLLLVDLGGLRLDLSCTKRYRSECFRFEPMRRYPFHGQALSAVLGFAQGRSRRHTGTSQTAREPNVSGEETGEVR
jgi:hypothetical protein